MGDKRAVTGTIAFDASYPTGGETVSEQDLGVTNAEFVLMQPVAGYVFSYDLANQKVLAYWVDTTVDGSPMLQVPATTDLSALVAVPYLAIGT